MNPLRGASRGPTVFIVASESHRELFQTFTFKVHTPTPHSKIFTTPKRKSCYHTWIQMFDFTITQRHLCLMTLWGQAPSNFWGLTLNFFLSFFPILSQFLFLSIHFIVSAPLPFLPNINLSSFCRSQFGNYFFLKFLPIHFTVSFLP